jgi:predicted transposase YbfD/YdcC
VVSAWAGEEEIVLGQAAVNEKRNGITAIPKLPGLPDIKGAMVAIDAMGCQREAAAENREREADYLLLVKDNQPAPHRDIREYFEERMHGRREQGEVRAVTDIGWTAGKKGWKGLKTIIRYRCWRTAEGETARSDRYYISNAGMEGERFYRYLRSRWPVENRLHWSLDVVFREDAAQAVKGHVPENLNILRKPALTLFRAAPDPRPPGGKRKMPGPQKRCTAAMNPDYILTVLFGK